MAPNSRPTGKGWTVSRAGLTHEQFVHDVRAAAVAWATARGTITEAEAERILVAKLVYGAGDGRYRGVCHYSAWANGVGPVEVVEIAGPTAPPTGRYLPPERRRPRRPLLSASTCSLWRRDDPNDAGHAG